MTIQKFIVCMMGQPCVKDSKMHWWILHGDVCYVQFRDRSLVMYIADIAFGFPNHKILQDKFLSHT
jgi:hypothetical protein